VLQKEHASAEEMKSALIEAMSHINALDDAQRHEWERAICYLHALILHRRPAEEHEDWITFFVEQTSQGKEIDIMRTIADMHYEEGIEKGREEGIEQGRQEGREEGHQEGREEGREEGERKGTIESILALLGARFHPDAVQALKPTIETIDDLSRLKELLLAVPYAQSAEAFTKTLYQ
jgi:flagellar biosynthesis/type III secretory pathway protein FliH